MPTRDPSSYSNKSKFSQSTPGLGFDPSAAQEKAKEGRLQSAFRRAIREEKRRNNLRGVLDLEQRAAGQGVNLSGLTRKNENDARTQFSLDSKQSLMEKHRAQQEAAKSTNPTLGLGREGVEESTSPSQSGFSAFRSDSRPSVSRQSIMNGEDDSPVERIKDSNGNWVSPGTSAFNIATDKADTSEEGFQRSLASFKRLPGETIFEESIRKLNGKEDKSKDGKLNTKSLLAKRRQL